MPQIRAEKDALAKKLKAMESKILKGDAAGGLAEVTRKKEEELRKKEEDLEKRSALGWGRALALALALAAAWAERPAGAGGMELDTLHDGAPLQESRLPVACIDRTAGLPMPANAPTTQRSLHRIAPHTHPPSHPPTQPPTHPPTPCP